MDNLHLEQMLNATAAAYSSSSSSPLLFTTDFDPFNPTTFSANPALEAYCKSLLVAPNAPSTTAEDFVFEFIKTSRDDAGFTTITFNKEDISACFAILEDLLSLCWCFREEIIELLGLCPLNEGALVERRLLVDWLVEAADQLGMDWAQTGGENPVMGRKERASVMFSVIFACVVQRKRKEKKFNDELDGFMAEFMTAA